MTLRLDTLDIIRDVEYARSYLWRLWFPEITSGAFASWFPAVSVDEPIGDLQSYDFEIGCHAYKVPQKHGSQVLAVTFLDDATHSLEGWMQAWIWEVFPQSRDGVATLDSALKKCHLMKLSPQKEVIHTRQYDVYPEGPVTNVYNSNAEVKSFSISFVVVGITE